MFLSCVLAQAGVIQQEKAEFQRLHVLRPDRKVGGAFPWVWKIHMFMSLFTRPGKMHELGLERELRGN